MARALSRGTTHGVIVLASITAAPGSGDLR
jgi:hypothetical protein